MVTLRIQVNTVYSAIGLAMLLGISSCGDIGSAPEENIESSSVAEISPAPITDSEKVEADVDTSISDDDENEGEIEETVEATPIPTPTPFVVSVVSSVPISGATGSELNLPVSLTLDKEITESSIIFKVFVSGTNTALAGTVSYDAPTKMVTFFPTANLSEDEDYDVSFSVTGLSTPHTFTFTTGWTRYFMLGTNSISNSISSYSINNETGKIEIISNQIASGNNPNDIAIIDSLDFFYVIDDSNIWIYSINRDTGVIASAGASVNYGANYNDMEIHSSGKFLYISDGGNTRISYYQIDQTTGALSGLTHVALAPATQTNMNLHPNGSSLIFNNTVNNTILNATINAITGALTMGAPTSVTNIGAGTMITPFSYYSIDGPAETIDQFTLSDVGGLTQINPSVPGGYALDFIDKDPYNRFFYYYYTEGPNVGGRIFDINQTTGGLTQNGADVPNLSEFEFLPNGKIIYIYNGVSTFDARLFDASTGLPIGDSLSSTTISQSHDEQTFTTGNFR
jgi:hypothetical protein